MNAYESIYTIVYYVKETLCDIKPITRSRMFIRLFCHQFFPFYLLPWVHSLALVPRSFILILVYYFCCVILCVLLVFVVILLCLLANFGISITCCRLLDTCKQIPIRDENKKRTKWMYISTMINQCNSNGRGYSSLTI